MITASAFVPDISVAVAWCFADEATPFTEKLLETAEAGIGLIVPVLWRHELSNALLFAKRKGRVTEEEIVFFLSRLQKLAIVRDLASWEHATGATRRLAAGYGLTVYDAAYLELAMRRRLPLATFDSDLKKAAEAVHVALVQPS